ncbi:acetyltransferase [Streptomyces sp. TRM66268-LWL]|uniref:Acetyltransferase n=1 Tax=Streptomyces polyasparticus TaxID=2767826 RepID=A0ABR7SSN6_9ACTN|nr:acetyltransferase [Streptomyces polyasparticus]MBC9717977.1 acetyltransferase [Streptomyces polyasparticus]
MRKSVRRAGVLSAGVALATGIGMAPAHAATPAELCGSGYSTLETRSIQSGGTTVARVSLLYNAGTGYNCVVTVHAGPSVGVATYTLARLEVQGGASKSDPGTYSQYAGPVRLSAAGRCVSFTGSITWGGATRTYNSGWGHCG